MSTYRDNIQELIRSIWENYDKTGALRDCAVGMEKNACNNARGKLYDAAIALSELDNSLTADRANSKL